MQPRVNGGGGGCGDTSEGEATSHNTDRDTSLSLGVELAPISPLELLNGGKRQDGAEGEEDLLAPDPPTVVIDSEDSPPTAKQKRIARVVMVVAFVLLAMCVILVGVTLSMSDHIDDLVRKAQLREKGPMRPAPAPTQTENATSAASLD